MSTHPESFYDAKRAVIEATQTARYGIDRPITGRQVTDVLAALGWPIPEKSIEGTGKGMRRVRVFRADVRYRLPLPVSERLLAGKRRSAGLTGYVAAPTKTAAAHALMPSWLTGSKRTKDIYEVEPSDYRYALAVEHPNHVVLTADGTEFGEPVLVPITEMTGGL